MVPEAGVEPVREKISRDFKSRASANSAIPAFTTYNLPITPILYHSFFNLSIPFSNQFLKNSKLILTFARKYDMIFFVGNEDFLSAAHLYYMRLQVFYDTNL